MKQLIKTNRLIYLLHIQDARMKESPYEQMSLYARLDLDNM
jgi:hypothetical protein